MATFTGATMSINNHNREGGATSSCRDKGFPFLVGKFHNCAPTKVHPYAHLELAEAVMRYTIIS